MGWGSRGCAREPIFSVCTPEQRSLWPPQLRGLTQRAHDGCPSRQIMRVREVLVCADRCREPHAGRAARAARRRNENGERGKKLKVSAQNRRKKLKAAPAPARLKMLKVTDPPETQPWPYAKPPLASQFGPMHLPQSPQMGAFGKVSVRSSVLPTRTVSGKTPYP